MSVHYESDWKLQASTTVELETSWWV